MLRSVLGNLSRSGSNSASLSPTMILRVASPLRSSAQPQHPLRLLQKQSFATKINAKAPVHENWRPQPVAPEDMPFLHHGKRPRYTSYKKFIMPRKRANKMMLEITNEAIAQSKVARPAVWDSGFQVGDAIEVVQMKESYLESKKVETLRGVVMGIFRRRLDQTVLIRKCWVYPRTLLLKQWLVAQSNR